MPEIRQARPLEFPPTAELKFLPEGPIPLGESRFSWVAIQLGLDATTGSVNEYDLASGQHRSFPLPGRPGFAFACQTPSTYVVGCERSLGLLDTSTNLWKPFCEGIDADVNNTIINDGLAYQDNLIFGTKDLEFATQKAGLYLYRGSDDKLIRLRSDQICSNGKAIIVASERASSAAGSKPDNLRLIDIDSPTRKIVSYPLDIAGGSLGQPSVVLDLTDDPAVPDGMIMTPDGSGIIVAMFNPGVVPYGETRLYDFASGELRCTWQTPGSPQNTCPALVRHQGSLKLIITTAVENLSAEDQAKCPGAGQIFIGDTDIEDPGTPLESPFPR